MIMSKRPRFGKTFEEEIEWLVDDLQEDEKDLEIIIEIVRDGFGFAGDELAEGVRSILLALTCAGARPAM